MKWSDEYTVGIPEIDDQHKKLGVLISALENSVDVAQDRNRVHSNLVLLAKYNRAHFAVEETLMRAHAYPGSEAHLNEHQQFRLALADLERRSAMQHVKPELIALIRAWEQEHVMVSDRHLARHINLSEPSHSPGQPVESSPDGEDLDRE